LLIYYFNPLNNIENTQIVITNLDTNTLVFSSTLIDPNQASILFDFSTLAYNDSSLFRIEATSMQIGNNQPIITYKYFNLKGNVGNMRSELAFVFALLLTIFGLTLARPSLSIGWLGLLVVIGSLLIISMAVVTTGLLLLTGVNVVIMLFILVTMFSGSNEVEILR
jgi:hypothetical protein